MKVSNKKSSGVKNSSTKTPLKSVGNQIKVKSIRWSPEEDNILLEEVKNCPNNLTAAFKSASERLPLRSPSACMGRWYSIVSKNDGKDSVVFACVSKHYIGKNRKNFRGTIDSKKQSMWSRIWGSITSFLG